MANLVSDFWTSRKVLITGATGLVGRHLVPALIARGAHPVLLIHDNEPDDSWMQDVEISRGSLSNRYDVERAVHENGVDVIVHLGAQTQVRVANRSPWHTFEANIRGTYNLLEACRTSSMDPIVVVASSDKAYGETSQLPYTEDMPVDGIYPYDVSKSCTDLVARSYAETYRIRSVIARCGNIFGPGDLNWDRIVPGTIRSLHSGQRPIIRSDGSSIRDYVYVGDIVDAYLLLAETAYDQELAGKAFNFSLDTPVSVIELVDLIRELMDRQDLQPIILDHASAEIREQYLSSSMARTRLGWTPTWGIEDGLRSTIDWYVDYLQQ